MSEHDDGETDSRDSARAGSDDEPGAHGDESSAREDLPEDVPVWDDEYLDRVSDRLLHSYDLERDVTAGGERFPLYGRLAVTSQKHFLHPSLNYANHEATEHLYARRLDSLTLADLERYVELGHELADERIEADEEHYSTDFTFALVVPRIGEDVRSFVESFEDRTLLKYGYYGHYELNLLVAAPDEEAVVASESTDLDRAFALWETPEEESTGLLDRLF